MTLRDPLYSNYIEVFELRDNKIILNPNYFFVGKYIEIRLKIYPFKKEKINITGEVYFKDHLLEISTT